MFDTHAGMKKREARVACSAAGVYVRYFKLYFAQALSPRASDKTPVHRKGPLGHRKCAALKIMSSKYEKLVRYVKSYQVRKLLTLN